MRYQIGLSFEDIALKGLRTAPPREPRLIERLAERLKFGQSGRLHRQSSFVQWWIRRAIARQLGASPQPVHCMQSAAAVGIRPPELRDRMRRHRSKIPQNTITTGPASRHLDEIAKQGTLRDQEMIRLELHAGRFAARPFIPLRSGGHGARRHHAPRRLISTSRYQGAPPDAAFCATPSAAPPERTVAPSPTNRKKRLAIAKIDPKAHGATHSV